MDIKLTPEELEAIKDDVRFKEQVLIGLKRLEKLPCETNDKRMTAIENIMTAIKTQVYFQWAVLFVVLVVIVIKG